MNYSLLAMFVNLQTRNEKFWKLPFGVASENLPLRNHETQNKGVALSLKPQMLGQAQVPPRHCYQWKHC